MGQGSREPWPFRFVEPGLRAQSHALATAP